jgi:membrane protein implicated in regulation of membrane protease activity
MIILSSISEFVKGGGMMSVYWGFAIGGSAIFAITAVSALFGLGGAESGDVDVDMDGEIDIVHPDSGIFDFKLISFRSILAFIAMFGWGGVVFGDYGWKGFGIAIACGLVTMVITAYLIMSILKLQQSGTRANASLVGRKGTVYLAIPAGGRGKVILDLGDSTREITAYSDVALAKGAPVETTALNAEVFTVKPL